MTRRQFLVRGVVQSVGFRPFVAGLAARYGLSGSVRNESGAVRIEVEGPDEALAHFGRALVAERPPLATIDSMVTAELTPTGLAGFHIEVTEARAGRRTSIPPDVATCDACLREMHDPADRRYRYPFLNCTQCGPRFTIIESLPYDRASTTMRRFAMCEACRQEYEDPADRRYHAEPTACPVCGPHLWFEAPGVREEREAALSAAREWLSLGRIVAVKGVGGFHLACLASHDAAVAALRARKGRGDKPFALMVADLAAARALCHVEDEAARQLAGVARPIVLLPRRSDPAMPISAGVAPGQGQLGVMLPYAPLHHLLVGDTPLVMTSGNRSDEPIARENEEARTRLAGLADGFLLHDRDIHAVCDDSVVRVFRGQPLPIRRSRGFAPLPVRVPMEVPPLLAAGGELKATFCVAQGHDAYLSQHIGDMESMETMAAFERAVDHLTSLFGIAPRLVAIDSHPGYLSSRWAVAWAERRGVPVVAVQHHHAHHAAVMAEHGLDAGARVIGVVFDGTGYGLDGAVWGGEFFLGGYGHVERVGQLAYAPLPASDLDVRHGYRLALAHLAAAGLAWDEDLPSVQACAAGERHVLARRMARGIGMAPSSSMGRLFDAAASLLGVRPVSAYEAQAAMELEAVATEAGGDLHAESLYAFGVSDTGGPLHLKAAPVVGGLVADLRRGMPVPLAALRFHHAVAAGILAVVARVSRTSGARVVALSGGVFQNVLLLGLTVDALERAGFEVLTHRLVPPNDGGLSLGQALSAAAVWEAGGRGGATAGR